MISTGKVFVSFLFLADVLRECVADNLINVAFQKPTEISSPYREAGMRFGKENGVDGVLDYEGGNYDMFHTQNEVSPWWSVSLMDSFTIHEVKVYNRPDCCSDRLAGFRVEIMEEENVVFTYDHEGQTLDVMLFSIPVDPGVVGDKVRLSIPGRRTVLNVLEVEVYAESIAGAEGDPHIKTWIGEKYDFHGVCDLVLLSNPGFNNGQGMHIHIRNTRTRSWSFISTTAVSIGEEILQIMGGRDSMKYFLNGKAKDADRNKNDGVVGNFAGYKLKYQRISDKAVEYEVILDHTESILLKTWNRLVSVSMKNPREEHFGGSVGLMGSFPNGIKLARDNATIISDSNIFGQEWQVIGSEPNLFTETEEPQFPSMCDIPLSIDMRRRLASSIVNIEKAKAACAGVTKEKNDLCIFDVMVTNDVGLAGAY